MLGRALRELVARWPLTGAGGWLAGAGALAAWTGLGGGPVPVGVAGGLLLAAVALAGAWVLAAARRVRTALAAPLRGLQLEEGVEVGAGEPPTWPWWMAPVEVTWRWVGPVAEARVIETVVGRRERVRPVRRGRYREVVRAVEVRDGLGLVAVRFQVAAPAAGVVMPSVGRLSALSLEVGRAGGDGVPHPDGDPVGDLVDVRAYAPGDPIRYVLWKVYARTQRVVVRSPEKALAPVTELRAWLVAGPGDDAAAGAAWVAVCAASGPWRLGADGVGSTATTREEAVALLAASADTPADAQGAGLLGFLGEGAGLGATVFVPGRPGPWLPRVVDALGRASATTDVLVVVDAVAAPGARAWWRRPVAPDPRAVSREELGEVVRALGRAARSVRVVRRADGVVEGLGLEVAA